MILNDKKILVVGAAGLLGATLVKELVAQGAKVVAVDISLERLEKKLIENDLDLKGGFVETWQLDLADKDAVVSMFNSLDGVNGAVNCAYPRNKKYGKHFFDVSVEDFNENVSLNLGSSFLLMQQCAVYFKRTNIPFSLVNISSIYGVVAPKFEIYDGTSMTMPVEYAAIKAALIHLSKYTTKYVSDSRFRVNLVSPGGVFDHQPELFLDKYRKHTFGTGMLDVDDVLGSIIFLLSDKSKYINAQNLIVDDGFTV
ncbi:oxidoreductase [Marinomonas lutimaris]|uniref:oxidoreductase n=1 Tax=Marinomonas lutimaris TaxID=2846746 RepID=UPI001C672A5B|nr:oxidoreductase [Marinomonas lutimaris]